MNVKEMIYIKGERIIFTPDKFEYDITDYKRFNISFKTTLLQMTFSPIQSMKALLTLLAHFLTLFLISQCQGKIS